MRHLAHTEGLSKGNGVKDAYLTSVVAKYKMKRQEASVQN